MFLLLLFLQAGCEGPWPLDAGYDPLRCDPPCAKGELCHGGQCRCRHPSVTRSCKKAGGFEWCTIPAGCFLMGSPVYEPCRDEDETLHEVTLTHGFEISATETTQGQYQTQLGSDLSAFKDCGAACPVEKVTWHDAAAYCNALSTSNKNSSCYRCTGNGISRTCQPAAGYKGDKIFTCPGYRLPTEAEWEYAYRAGSQLSVFAGQIAACYGDDPLVKALGWNTQNAEGTTRKVGQKTANGWGLLDMGGNTWEWCHDWYQKNLGAAPVVNPAGPATGDGRIVRGGSYVNANKYLRAAERDARTPVFRSATLGFRCVRTLGK